MHDHRHIGVCAAGDPASPRTWSGTPHRICAELESRGLLRGAIDVDAYGGRAVQFATKALSKLYYTGSRYVGHGILCHAVRSRAAELAARRLNCAAMLHMGTVAVPSRREQTTVRHYTLVDSTWRLWTAMNTDRSRISRRLYGDADRLEGDALRAADHVFTTAEYVRASVIEEYGVPAQRVTAVGTGRGALVADDSPKDYENGVVLFVAKDRFHDKGGHLLVEGFQQAYRQNPRLKLVIAGNDAHRDYIPQGEAIEVHGFISLEQLQALFHRAALFALPAINEPWGLVYLESLACRVPVLGLKRNALPEITGEGAYGFYAAEPTADGVADAILRAFAEPAKLEAMGRGGQAHCLRTFTWPRTVEQMVNVIEREAA